MSSSDITIARAEELAPGSTIAMDYQIPEIINGGEFLLHTTGSRKPDRIQASCRLPGARRRDCALGIISQRSMLNYALAPPPHMRPLDESLHFALNATAGQRLTTTWHAKYGVWCTMHMSFPAGGFLNDDDPTVSVERVDGVPGQWLITPCLPKPPAIRGHRADLIIIDDPYGAVSEKWEWLCIDCGAVEYAHCRCPE